MNLKISLQWVKYSERISSGMRKEGMLKLIIPREESGSAAEMAGVRRKRTPGGRYYNARSLRKGMLGASGVYARRGQRHAFGKQPLSAAAGRAARPRRKDRQICAIGDKPD
ncbi:hypothetical protein [Paenibacillus protaetiae]|uniref:Uncharacterized protein n=1 Tax=Paenibacillus protaetiae TaxID=2509456 RepID=A0A4P6EYV3_9BACL|nr:hypothetical protein [Paenibacillus protaetiae]QAY67433.1 hypothetical protein ET464_14585 [Paenibacillus protaetiae]